MSGGYALPSLLPVYAADVTVPEVVVDASHPAVTTSEPGPINKKTTPTPPIGSQIETPWSAMLPTSLLQAMCVTSSGIS
ncbi:hypothetical protein [Selenomonas felix]|uniref:hypothetical protein n=1 Tax=Selenomonas felix TaxID=1944634 RepID=UPI001482770D|nr:hypothetical protein [Selenomonas felix]